MTVNISPPKRYPGGKRVPPATTKAAIEAAQRAREEAEKAVVLNQPHRRGNNDQRCENALGRFCLQNKLAGELYDAGQQYASLVRQWRIAIANIHAEGHKNLGSKRDEITREEAEKITRRVLEAESALRRVNACAWVRHIAVDDKTGDERKLPKESRQVIIDGLLELAVHFGMRR